jgi:hypothetical protein
MMRNTTLLRLCLALLGLVPAAALAQEPGAQPADGPSRTALLAAARDQKATETAPPERATVERALYWYDNQYVLPKIFGGWKGIHLAGGDFPAGAGMKFGVGFDHAIGSTANRATADQTSANRFDVDALAAYSTRGYQRAGAGFTVRRIGGAAVDARVWGQRFEFPQEDLFGLGQDSRIEDRTSYLHESTEVGAQLTWTPGPFDVSGGLAYLDPRIGPGTDSRFPSAEQRFDAATLPGLTAQPDFLRTDAGAAFDWRDNPLHPHAGGRYGLQFSNFDDRDLGQYGFRRVTVDVQQYVPLPNRYRVIALRAAAVMTDAGAAAPASTCPSTTSPRWAGARSCAASASSASGIATAW